MYFKYNDEDCMMSMCCDIDDDETLMCLHVIDRKCV